jgi:hypothetical protein
VGKLYVGRLDLLLVVLVVVEKLEGGLEVVERKKKNEMFIGWDLWWVNELYKD